MSILLNEDETQQCSGRFNGYHGSSTLLPVCQPAPQSNISAHTSTSETSRSNVPAWKRILPWSWMAPSRGSIGPTSSNPVDGGTTHQLESHLCVDKCWSSTHDTRMMTLESMEHMQSDYEYFCQARHILSRAEGSWLQRKLSWRSYTRVTLSRVCMKNVAYLEDDSYSL